MIEPREKRRKRFETGGMVEVAETILNSYANFLIPRLAFLIENKLYDFALVGMYAIGYTVSEKILGKSKNHFKKFLEEFVDTDEHKYSPIATKIKLYRDVMMHQWMADSNYDFALDAEISDYLTYEEGVTLLNPIIFFNDFKNAFQAGGKIWAYADQLGEEQEAVHTRFMKGYSRKF